MAKLEIEFVADVDKLIAGTDDAATGLEETGTALEELQRSAAETARTAGTAMDDIGSAADEAGRATTAAMDDATTSLDDVADAAGEAGRDITTGMDDATTALDDLGDAAGEAGRDITTGIGDGTAGAIRDVETMETAVERTFAAVADDAASAGDGIADGIQGGTTRAGSHAATEMERRFADVFAEVAADAAAAGDNIADGMQSGTERAASAATGLKTSGTASFKDLAGVLSGDMDKAASSVESALTGLSNKMPGIAGIATAVLGGVAVQLYQSWKENTEKIEARVKSMFDDMRQSGQDYLSDQFIEKGAADIMNSEKDAVIDYAKAQDIAAASGVDLASVIRAYAGDAEAATTLTQALTRAVEENEAKRATADVAATQGVITGTTRILNGYKDALAGVAENTESAAARAEVWNEITAQSAGSLTETADAQIKLTDAITRATDALNDNGASLDLTTEAGKKNFEALVNLGEATATATETTLALTGATEETASTVREGYQRFLDLAWAMGMDADAAAALADELGLIPDVEVTASLDTTPASDAAADLAATDPGTLTFGTAVDGSDLQYQLDRAIARVRRPTITARVHLSPIAV